jgi:O-antigen ligase
MILLVVLAGVILTANDGVDTVAGVRKVGQGLLLGCAFSSLVAMSAYFAHVPVVDFLRTVLPGFEDNSDYLAFEARGALDRVAGTALHPIEFGAVAALTIPLAMSRLMLPRRRLAVPLAVVGVIVLAIPMSVSRSAILGLAVALLVYIPLHRPQERLVLALAAPIGIGAVALSAPGYIATIRDTVLGSGTDASVLSRLVDYREVAERFREHPWMGSGIGSYVPRDSIEILDNQYLKSLIEVGGLGMLAVLAFLALPAFLALAVRRRSRDPVIRELATALAAGCVANLVLCGTFDAFSFPTYTCTYAVMVGMIGACWRIAYAEPRAPLHGPPDPRRQEVT